jgi:hypothetical protein
MYFAALFDLLEWKRRLMRLSKCLSYLLTAALIVPAGLWASQQPCQTSAPTALSKTWNFPKETTELLNSVRVKAYAVQRDSEGLARLSRYNQLDWAIYSDHLARIRNDVNKMGEDLCRLQVVRRAALPWQRHEIDRITPTLKALAARTQAAIELLSSHEQTFWATNFPTDLADIRADATQIHKSVANEVEYAKVQSSSGTSSTSSGM